MSAGSDELAFRSMIRASGLGEVWTHGTDDVKFSQYGWRCTTKEDAYKPATLIGNWNEKNFDIERLKVPKRLPSQYEHYFETTQGASYNKEPAKVPEVLKHLEARETFAFPGHQPELDHPSLKAEYNAFETTSRAGYIDPKNWKLPSPQTSDTQLQ
ncbi:cilia- and flagella-associated protein 68-like [Ptychodera flava]|uniref:cilia- and flagella-associated protein 68-like n=1 Tax=Ptychodera flava TaxID=63121 RepID=UPI003969F5EE